MPINFRIIPVILLKDNYVVKSKKFSDYRFYGSVEQTIAVFNRRSVDEIIILDINKNKQGVNHSLLKLIVRDALMPLSYGGGVNSVKDIEQCLLFGADRVIINTASINKPNLIKRAIEIFGAQCIVVNVDISIHDEKYRIFNYHQNTVYPKKLFDYINELLEMGVGEICFNLVDRDGTMQGYDVDFLESIKSINIKIPILISGGCSKPEDILILEKYNIQGACMSSIFYYTEYSYSDIKRFLSRNSKSLQIRI